MMHTTMISSIRVSPEAARSRVRDPDSSTRPLTFAARKSSLPQVPHGEEYAKREYQHQYTQQHYQDGLDLRRERLQLVFDFPLIHFGHFTQQIIELSGFLAHGDHLQHHGSEHSGGHRVPQQAFAAFDSVADLPDSLPHVRVVHDLFHHRQGLHYGHAALKSDRKRARKPRECRLEHDFARDRDA